MAIFSELNMDAFTHAQMASKLRLCKEIESRFKSLDSLWIYGSWYGTLAFLLLSRENIKIGNICLFDIDAKALQISKEMLNYWSFEKNVNLHFFNHDCNCFLNADENPSLIINTSCEHFKSQKWLEVIPSGVKFCIQSTNMKHHEHISCTESIEQFTLSVRSIVKEVQSGYTQDFNYGNFSFSRFTLFGEK